jgi:hypothetical protein
LELGCVGRKSSRRPCGRGISLRANGVSTLPIPLDIRFDNLAAAGVSLRGTDSLLLGMQLGLEVALPYMGSVRLDVGAKTEIPVLKPPVVRPERIRVDRISLSGADITLTANVKNPNSRMLTVQTLEGRLIVGGREWGLIGLGGDASLPPGDERTISLRASVDFGEVGRSAWSLLSRHRERRRPSDRRYGYRCRCPRLCRKWDSIGNRRLGEHRSLKSDPAGVLTTEPARVYGLAMTKCIRTSRISLAAVAAS